MQKRLVKTGNFSVAAIFWKIFGDKIPPEVPVLSSIKEVDPREVRTALNQALPIRTAPKRAFLFFIDFEPEANWGHRCAYAFVNAAGESSWYEAEWPPLRVDALKLQNRPLKPESN